MAPLPVYSRTAEERTDVFENPEDILACALDILPQIRYKHDLCLDSWGPSTVLGTEVVRKAVVALHMRGAKIRLITEITSANIDYCREFMKFAEVRHLDNVQGNFSVSDGKWYTASAVTEKDKPPPRLILSTVKEIINQHQHFFETLWDKAKLAEQKISELEEGRPAEKIEVIRGRQNVANAILRFHDNIQRRIDVLADSTVTNLSIEYYENILEQASGRNIQIRYLTEITKDNLAACKRLSHLVELRHIGALCGNFSINENEFITSPHSIANQSEPDIIYTNAPPIVEQNKFLFETLWNNSISAEQRIREIEEGIEPVFVEVITDGTRASDIMVEFAKSVRKSAKIILPNAIAMKRGEKLGIWKHLATAANNYGAEIKVITPVTEENEWLANQITNASINIQIIPGPASHVGLFIQDGIRYFRAEYRNPDSTDFVSAINIIYSNSKSGSKWFEILFDALVKQNELYEQLAEANKKLSNHDVAQKEFINIAAHELRTPIQPILGRAELLKAEIESGIFDPESVKEAIDMVVRNAQRLQRLTEDVLVISRIDRGIFLLNKEEFDIVELVKEIVNDTHNHIRAIAKKIKIELEEPGQAIRVVADRLKIAQVINNLLNNSIKFTSEGAIRISIERGTEESIENSDRRAFVKFTIVDSGPGIDQHLVPHLFAKFATLDPKMKGNVTTTQSGTGLGLYISKHIIDAHGGKIEGKNNEGTHGARFTFTLPL